MGILTKIIKSFLYFAVPLAGVLLYFHLECVREKEEKLREKFNPDYFPDQTDCTAELPFFKQDVDRVELSVGIIAVFRLHIL